MRKKKALEKKMETMAVGQMVQVKNPAERMDAHNWAKKFGYQIRTARHFVPNKLNRVQGFEIWRIK